MLRQFRRAIRHKKKRQRKKQWGKLVDMTGYDSEGLRNYVKIAKIIDGLTVIEVEKIKRGLY